MPEVLERCVRHMQGKGYPESRGYAICAKSTGWRKAPGGGWRKKKDGKWIHHSGKHGRKKSA